MSSLRGAMDQIRSQAPTRRHGIPSYADLPTDTNRTVKLAADAIEQRGITAAQSVLADIPDGDRILTALCSTGDVAWRHLIDVPLDGPYLDATASFGTRAHVFAEGGHQVCALEPDFHQLRIAAARDDFDTEERVFPIHGDITDVPVPANKFRTVVADDSIRDVFAEEGGLRAAVKTLKHALTTDGTLVMKLDGWFRRTGLDTQFYADDNHVADSESLREAISYVFRSNAVSYRSIFADTGFTDISIYALFPSRRGTEFAFAVDDRPAIEWFVSKHVQSSGIHRLIRAVDRFGLLKQVYPSYLVVCSLSNSSSDVRSSHRDTGTLLRPGYNRSVAFDIVNDTLDQVRKFPNADSRATTTRNEAEVLRRLRDDAEAGGSIVKTLPNGHTESTVSGSIRVEEPAFGTLLSSHLNDDPQSLYRTLSAALSWLASFQTAFRGDSVRRRSEDITADLDAPGTRVAPPTPDGPVNLFRTPVHGDFHLWNIYITDGEVSTVIDWEFAELDGLPTTDVGTFLQYAWTNVLGSHEDGFESVIVRETPYAAAVQRAVKEYCDRTGVAPRAIGWYLTHGSARALRFAEDNPELYSPWTTKFVEWVDRIHENDAAVQSFFESIDSGI